MPRRLLAVLCALSAAPAGLALAQDPVNPQPPLAATEPARDVGQTTATLVARVTPRGAETTVRFEYGTSTSYGLTSAERSLPADAPEATVEIPVTGLTADTTYHFRVVATNAAGKADGEDRTLRTTAPPAPPSPPAVSTSSATSVTSSSARLNGRADPNGLPTRVRFEYGTSSRSLGTQTPEQDAGAGTSSRSFGASIGGLPANRRIYHRIVATNAAGTSRGAIRSFVTRRALRGIEVRLSSPAVVFGRALEVSGRVTGSGVSGVTVALELDGFPFTTGFRQFGGTVRTSSSGAFRFPAVPALFATTRVRVVARTSPVLTSPVAVAYSRPIVGALPSRRTRRSVLFRGSVRPPMRGARVSLQRRSPSGRWVRVGQAHTAIVAGGVARYRVRIAVPRRGGVHRAVVIPERGGAHIRGFSTERTLRAR